MKIVSVLFLTLGTSTAFTVPMKRQRHTPLFVASSEAIDDTFYQAVQLAEQGKKMVDLEELDRLATELEEFEGSRYEKDSGFGEKEIQDRIDVAEILRLQIELQLRLDYLKGANLFAEDVRKEHDARERKKLKDALVANRDKAPGGSDLGLW